jgi:hypothetical protein
MVVVGGGGGNAELANVVLTFVVGLIPNDAESAILGVDDVDGATKEQLVVVVVLAVDTEVVVNAFGNIIVLAGITSIGTIIARASVEGRETTDFADTTGTLSGIVVDKCAGLSRGSCLIAPPVGCAIGLIISVFDCTRRPRSLLPAFSAIGDS